MAHAKALLSPTALCPASFTHRVVGLEGGFSALFICSGAGYPMNKGGTSMGIIKEVSKDIGLGVCVLLAVVGIGIVIIVVGEVLMSLLMG